MSKAWMLKPGQGLGSLRLVTKLSEPLGYGQVRVALKAMSLNARDLMVANGQSPMPVAEDLIPLSDGAGLVAEIGDGVDRVTVGDRVVITFNPAHQNGPFEAHMAPHALGELHQGVLSEEAVFDQMALVKLPDIISFEQAACLPCAGVTAWNALFGTGPLMPGQTVLATGTGNVSLSALRLAKAAGARVGITSSDSEKIERVLALGADFGVNYRTRPDWNETVREATAGHGADIVLENAGPPSIATSIRAAAHGARVVQIGWKGLDGPPISVIDMALGGVSLTTVMVGSRAMLGRLVAAVSVNRIQMPIHATFAFADAPNAFQALADGDTFGKIVITTN